MDAFSLSTEALAALKYVFSVYNIFMDLTTTGQVIWPQ